ncbi:MAG TPA: GNAT family N-acetyltransferase [Candidatus Dormibacteraeota bacterium]|nr:GNAT family N-acetyltransferase [Candidatus Dormibacteraeota bacterium]
MRFRSASLRDLVRIEQIYREAEAGFSAIPPPARLWGLVSHTLSALLPLTQETLIYVAEEEGRVVGFVQASGHPLTVSLPSSVTSLQVLNLCVAESVDEQHVAPSLIQYLCDQAVQRGVSRLFVRLPLDEPLMDIFRFQGFRQYATESVLYAESPRPRSTAAPSGLRPYRNRDQRRLYHLYRKVTPWGVAHLEAPTFREWRSTRSAPGQQEVIDRVEIVGWCRVQKGSQARPSTLSFMALPERGLADELVDHAIVAADGQAAWCSLRHYDAHVIDALRGRGFSLLLTQALLVRELTVRAPLPEKGLVPSFG